MHPGGAESSLPPSSSSSVHPEDFPPVPTFDIAGCLRGQCLSCSECPAYICLSGRVLCDYCGCPPARHVISFVIHSDRCFNHSVFSNERSTVALTHYICPLPKSFHNSQSCSESGKKSVFIGALKRVVGAAVKETESDSGRLRNLTPFSFSSSD